MTEECGKREEQDLKQILCRQAQFNWLHDGWADGKSDVNVEKLKLFSKMCKSSLVRPCSMPSFYELFRHPQFAPFSSIPLKLIALIHESCRRAGSLKTIKELWKEANHSRTRRAFAWDSEQQQQKVSFMSSTMLTRNFFCKRHHSQTSTTHQTTKMEDSITLHIARCAALWVK